VPQTISREKIQITRRKEDKTGSEEAKATTKQTQIITGEAKQQTRRSLSSRRRI